MILCLFSSFPLPSSKKKNTQKFLITSLSLLPPPIPSPPKQNSQYYRFRVLVGILSFIIFVQISSASVLLFLTGILVGVGVVVVGIPVALGLVKDKYEK